VYDRRIAGKELTFGVSGKLHANSLIMYDHQTDSLWSHLVGAAVTGPLNAEKLKPLESMFTRWDTWSGLYPKSKVLTSGRGFLFGSSLRDPYESYYKSSDTGIIPTRLSDRRVYPKEFVLGLVVGGKAKAYPYSALSREPVVNDVFEGHSILVVFEEESATGRVFDRELRGRTLTFRRTEPGQKKAVLLTDGTTGSIWNGLTGKAVLGPMKGQELTPRPVTPSFWFGWVDHYPQTSILGEKK
jgi:hypothetical protein